MYKLTTPVPCQADALTQTDFLDELTVLEAHVERGKVVLYYANVVHPTYNTRCICAWCEAGKERPLLTVIGVNKIGRRSHTFKVSLCKYLHHRKAVIHAQRKPAPGNSPI